MKKNLYLTLCLLTSMATGAFAQRHCDVKVLPLIGPENNSTYSCNSTVVSGYYFVNNGPDTILSTDKFFLLDPNIDEDSLGTANGNPVDPTDRNTFWFYPVFPTGTVVNGIIGEGEDAVEAPHVDVLPGDTILYYKWDDTVTRLHLLIIPNEYAISPEGDTIEKYYFVPDNYTVPPNGTFIWQARFLYFDTDVTDTVPGNDFANATITLNCSTAINDVTYKKVDLKVYPNPANNAINFRYSFLKSANVKARIMDLTGRTLKKMNLGRANAGEHQFEVRIDELPKGTYLLEFATDDTKGISKFTKN